MCVCVCVCVRTLNTNSPDDQQSETLSSEFLSYFILILFTLKKFCDIALDFHA